MAALATSLGALVVLLSSMSLAGAQTTTTGSPTTTAAPTTMAPTTTTYVAPSTTQARVVTTRAPVVTTAVPRTVASTAAVSTSAQPTTTVAPPTTVAAAAPATSAPALLVAGPNDTTPASGTTSSGLSSGTKLKLVIAGLIAVALAIGALTFAYWRHTRPYVWEQYEEPIDDGTTGEPTQVVPTPTLAGVTAAGAAGAAGAAEGSPSNGAAEVAPSNGAATNGSSPSPTGPTGPVVPSLIPADVLAPQLAIVTLEDLEQTDADTKTAAGPKGDDVGPPTAPMGPIDSDEPDRTGPVSEGS